MIKSFKAFLVPTTLFEPYLGPSRTHLQPNNSAPTAATRARTDVLVEAASPREPNSLDYSAPRNVSAPRDVPASPAARDAPPATPSFDLADVLAEFDADELELCLF